MTTKNTANTDGFANPGPLCFAMLVYFHYISPAEKFPTNMGLYNELPQVLRLNETPPANRRQQARLMGKTHQEERL